MHSLVGTVWLSQRHDVCRYYISRYSTYNQKTIFFLVVCIFRFFWINLDVLHSKYSLHSHYCLVFKWKSSIKRFGVVILTYFFCCKCISVLSFEFCLAVVSIQNEIMSIDWFLFLWLFVSKIQFSFFVHVNPLQETQIFSYCILYVVSFIYVFNENKNGKSNRKTIFLPVILVPVLHFFFECEIDISVSTLNTKKSLENARSEVGADNLRIFSVTSKKIQ